MKENYSMEWNMEWKIFIREWKNISSMEYGKIILHSIPYHVLPTASKLDVQQLKRQCEAFTVCGRQVET